MHQCVACAIAVLLVGAEPDGRRPSPEVVAAAVQESFARWKIEHPPLSQAGAIAGIQQEAARAKAGLEKAKATTGPERKAKMKSLALEIRDLEKRLAETKREYTPPEVVPKLCLMDWDNIRSGVVGRYYRRAINGDQLAVARCVQILGPDRILVDFEIESPDSLIVTKEIGGILKGIDTKSLVEGAEVDITELNLVVVGQRRFDTAIGSFRTVHVFEVFDPNKPFK